MVITVQWLLHFNYYYVKTSWYRYIHVEIPKNCKDNLYAPSHKLDIVFIERVHAKEFKAWMFFSEAKLLLEKRCVQEHFELRFLLKSDISVYSLMKTPWNTLLAMTRCCMSRTAFYSLVKIWIASGIITQISGGSRGGAWGPLILGEKRRNHKRKETWRGKENNPRPKLKLWVRHYKVWIEVPASFGAR